MKIVSPDRKIVNRRIKSGIDLHHFSVSRLSVWLGSVAKRLTHGKRGELGAKDSDERAWVEMQEELARLSSKSKHLFLEKSGHRIVLDQPEAVVEAIHHVVEAARRRKQ